MLKLSTHIKHFIIFGFSKSAVLIAPLLAASVLTKDEYGLLEWALSFSMMSALFLSLGAGGVIAFEIVKHERSDLIITALSYISFLTFFLGFTTAVIVLIDSDIVAMLLGFTGIFLGQFALSSYMKAKGMGAFASVVDSFIYILILLLVLFSIIIGDQRLHLFILLSAATLFFSVILFRIGGNEFRRHKNKFFKFVKTGAPIMLASFATVGFMNLPRVLIGDLGTMEDVADFALYFRWAALALLVYQFMVIINFRKIYQLDHITLDRYISCISLAVLIIGALFVTTMPMLREFEICKQLQFPQKNLPVQSLMVAIVAIWTLSASLEGLFYREHLTIFQIYSTISGILVLLLSILLIKRMQKPDLTLFFSLAWFISYLVIIFLQLFFLNKYLHKERKQLFVYASILVVFILLSETIVLILCEM